MKNTLLTLSIVSLMAATLSGASITTEAVDNRTVQPGGPRTGSSGLAFFNIEGSANGSFASFGLADFSFSALATPAASVDAADLLLIQNNAGFTTDGGLAIYATTNLAAPSGLFYDFGFAEEGLGAQLDPLTLLATGTFTEVSTGTTDTYGLDAAALESLLLPVLNNGGTLRLLVVPTEAATAATYAGYTNFTYDGPTLDIDYTVVPEPSALALLGLGGLALALIRRR